MTRATQSPPRSDLFDLPLVLDPESSEAEVTSSTAKQAVVEPTAEDSSNVYLAEPDASVSADRQEPEFELLDADDVSEPEPVAKTLLGKRLVAGGLDAAAVAFGTGILMLASVALGAGVRASDWPAYLLAALCLSFVYSVFSLVLWKRTPGMAQVGLTVCSTSSPGSTTSDEDPELNEGVSVTQALLRWAAGSVTWALLGLPALPALKDQASFADRVSGTRLEA